MGLVDRERSSVGVCVLGQIAVLVDGAVVDFGGARQRRLFALLVLHAGHVVDVNALAEHLWDEDERPDDFGRAIRTYISRIRRSLREAGLDATAVVTTAAPGYRIVLDDVSLDSTQFEELVLSARREFDDGNAARASGCLDEALLLWKGAPYAEFADRSWAEAESKRLVELGRAAAELQCACRIELGGHAEVIGDLEVMVSDDPLRARPVELLMLALFRADRQAEALRTAQRHRRALGDVGLDVSAALGELDSRIAASDESLRHTEPRRQRIQGASGGVAQPRSTNRVCHNLPIIDDELLGRDGELTEITTLLAHRRLVTIVGVGGIGKTRLALAAAANLVGVHTDGVWLCELASVSEPAAVADSVALAIGTRQHPGRSLADSVAEFCRGRDLLLVLDNCEHVLAAAAGLVQKILAVAPGVHILATSREGLGSGSEVTYPLRPLGTSGSASAATKLFFRRASKMDPGREWTDVDRASIEQICTRLDGIPLAIELAATRTRTQTPLEIVERLNEAFRSLRGGGNSVERHRTLKAAIDWSYAGLSRPEKALFERLSVFAGGCDLDAIEVICADDELGRSVILDVVDDLVSKSLVVVESGSNMRTRYRLLEPLRQYAGDRLVTIGGSEIFRDSHSDYYACWAERWNQAVYGPARDLHISLDVEFDNARAAFFWALDREMVDRACRIVAALSQAQESWRRLEVGSWGARVLELPTCLHDPLGPVVAIAAGVWCWWRNDLDEWERFIRLAESMDYYDPTAYLHAQILEGFLNLQDNDTPSSQEVLARAESSTVEERVYEAWHSAFRDIPSAESFAAAARLHELAAETGSLLVQIRADAVSGMVQLTTDLGAAATSSRRAIDAAETIDALYWIHWPLCWLGVATGLSSNVTSRDLWRMRDGLRTQSDMGDETNQWMVLIGASVALNNLVGPALAAEVHQGLQSSPWSNNALAGLVTMCVPEVEEFGSYGPTHVVLAELVSRVIERIDSLLDQRPDR